MRHSMVGWEMWLVRLGCEMSISRGNSDAEVKSKNTRTAHICWHLIGGDKPDDGLGLTEVCALCHVIHGTLGPDVRSLCQTAQS